MHYASIKEFDIANGVGVRTSLFVSGCRHHCKNCFNPEAWDFNYGNVFTEKDEEKILKSLAPSYITGLSLLGGEPLEPKNQEGLLPLLRKVKKKYPEKTIWCYTGFVFDTEVKKMMETSLVAKELLNYIDVLVDGRFVDELKNKGLFFRGSSNQRVIDLKETLKTGEIVLVKLEGEKMYA